MQSISVILATLDRPDYLERTLDSFAKQTFSDFEIVIADARPASRAREVAEKFGAALNLKYLAMPDGVARGYSRNRALRAADGDIVFLVEDSALIEPDLLERLASGAAGGMKICKRRALVDAWRGDAPPTNFRRLMPALRRAAERGAGSLLDPRRGPRERAFDDLVWERLAPALARFGPELNGFELDWLFGFVDNLFVAREAVFEVGLCDESTWEWDLGDAELVYRLRRAGLRISVPTGAAVYQYILPYRSWPQSGYRMADRFSERHGAVDAWLLLRFLGREDVLALNELAVERAAGSDLDAELDVACRALVPLLISSAQAWWTLP